LASFGSHYWLPKKYPVIFEYLQGFESKLRNRGQCRYTSSGKQNFSAEYPGQHHWLELDNNPRKEYLDDFYKQKIIYPDIMRMPRQEEMLKDYPHFYLDEESFFAEATNFIMTGQDIDLIYLFLTSEIGFFAFSKFYSGPQFDETGFRYKKAYLDNTYIPRPNNQKTSVLRKIIKPLKEHKDVADEINSIWAEVVGLNVEEINYVNRYKKSLLG
jgi:hypothetical protein